MLTTIKGSLAESCSANVSQGELQLKAMRRQALRERTVTMFSGEHALFENIGKMFLLDDV